MSKLKNTYGFTQSLLDTIKNVQEKKLHPNQEKLDVAEPKDKITADDFKKLRTMKEEEVVSEADKASNLSSPIIPGKRLGKAPKNAEKEFQKRKQRLARMYPNVKPSERAAMEELETSNRLGMILSKLREESVENIVEEEISEAVAPSMVSFLTQLLAIIRNLVPASAMRKLTKEELDIVSLLDEVGIDNLEEELKIFEEEMELNEARGRPKGSKNKPKTGMTPAAKPEDSKKEKEDDEEEDEGPSYPEASGKDTGHVMTQLSGIGDYEKGGGHITTAKGAKYVTKSTAAAAHKHLMSLKPSDRAHASSKIYNMDSSHPVVKKIESDHAEAEKRGIKAPKAVKGRGRPRKNPQ